METLSAHPGDYCVNITLDHFRLQGICNINFKTVNTLKENIETEDVTAQKEHWSALHFSHLNPNYLVFNPEAKHETEPMKTLRSWKT